jgi:hypothetical protein
MAEPIPDVAALPGVQRAYEPDPRDRLSGYAIAWGLWVVAFAVIEGVALHQDAEHRDRVKRTLSANLRYVFATDSVTGVPLDVPYGRVRRFALGVALGPGWLPNHLGREGVV